MTKKKRGIFIIVGIVLILILITILSRTLHHQQKQQINSTITVAVANAVIKPMPVEVQLTGNIEPLQSVNISPQTTGILTKINFTAGQIVKAGQLLFTINPVSYETNYSQAAANFDKDIAQLHSDQQDQQRLSKLVTKGYVSKEQYDQLIAKINMDKAIVEGDTSQVQQAKIELGYTQIKSPITGKTGDISVKEGDLITANTTTPLVTINQLNPVLVDFYLPQVKLTGLLNYAHKNPIWVEVFTEDGSKIVGKGKLVFVDNTINSETGTLLLKAKIPNPQHFLWPQQMVLVKLIFTTQPKALVIPSEAVNVDDQGNFVFLAKKGKAILTRIKVDRQMGNMTIVNKGLNPGDQVITEAPPELTDGSPIALMPSIIDSQSAKSKSSS
ncbi:MAG: hypothetical protein A3E87_05570 [Gammaproteobacteria bacterium RIFCSPHIGHO2_12_FULL_35_23]|nr:MAG: hypothetical protein A3E87_05570 [Gammaproteobacteria bacterium RIFCSPHIGHO2_12_FULL_35_23]